MFTFDITIKGIGYPAIQRVTGHDLLVNFFPYKLLYSEVWIMGLDLDWVMARKSWSLHGRIESMIHNYCFYFKDFKQLLFLTPD
jgi:hypothetical protein